MRKRSQYHLLEEHREIFLVVVENGKTFPLTTKKKKWKKGMSNVWQGRNGRRVDMDPHEGGSGTGAGVTGEPVQCPEQRGLGLGHLRPHSHVHVGSRMTATLGENATAQRIGSRTTA
jgi:hypothetical protein